MSEGIVFLVTEWSEGLFYGEMKYAYKIWFIISSFTESKTKLDDGQK